MILMVAVMFYQVVLRYCFNKSNIWSEEITRYMFVYVSLLASFTPIGVNISIYAQQYDQDYAYSVVLVCVSTILSIATVPLVYSLADHLI